MNPDEAPEETGSDPNVPVVKGDLRAAQNYVESTMKRGLFLSDIKALAMAALATLGGGYTVLHTLDSRAQEKVDGGVTLLEAKVDTKLATLQGEIGAMKQQLDENKSVTQATNDTVNKLAVRLGVVPTMPVPVQPARTDGGR